MTISLTCTCGARLEIDETFAGRTISCPDCQRSLTAPRPEAPGIRTSGLALLSFIVALTGAFTLLGTLAAVLLGFLALQQIKRRPDEVTGRNYAVAGIVLGGALSAVTGVAVFAPELFGLQNLPGQLHWAGRLDYSDDLEKPVASRDGSCSIKRPSARWGRRVDAKAAGDDAHMRTWGDLVLVNVAEDAHILVTQLNVPANATLNECTRIAFDDFKDKDKGEMFGRLRPTAVRGATAREVRSEELPGDDLEKKVELEIEKSYAGQDRRFLMRVVRRVNDPLVYVVVGGSRRANFERVRDDIVAALDSFKMEPLGLPR